MRNDDAIPVRDHLHLHLQRVRVQGDHKDVPGGGISPNTDSGVSRGLVRHKRREDDQALLRQARGQGDEKQTSTEVLC